MNQQNKQTTLPTDHNLVQGQGLQCEWLALTTLNQGIAFPPTTKRVKVFGVQSPAP